MMPRMDGGRSLSRRQAVAGGVAALAAMAARLPAQAQPAQDVEVAQQTSGPKLQLGLMTDVHHADKPPVGTRFYRDSRAKLEQALDSFAAERVDAILQLGDLIDAHETVTAEEQSLREVSRLIHQTGIPYHFVMGNHCLQLLSKRRFAELAGCADGHYALELGPLTVIALDANYRADGTAYEAGNFQWWDSFIPPAQLEWLGEQLGGSDRPAIILSHQRLDPHGRYSAANHAQVRKIIAGAGGARVKAVLQGHWHQNSLAMHDKIAYIVLAGMIEGEGLHNNAYGILQVWEDGSMRIKGYAQQKHWTLQRPLQIDRLEDE